MTSTSVFAPIGYFDVWVAVCCTCVLAGFETIRKRVFNGLVFPSVVVVLTLACVLECLTGTRAMAYAEYALKFGALLATVVRVVGATVTAIAFLIVMPMVSLRFVAEFALRTCLLVLCRISPVHELMWDLALLYPAVGELMGYLNPVRPVLPVHQDIPWDQALPQLPELLPEGPPLAEPEDMPELDQEEIHNLHALLDAREPMEPDMVDLRPWVLRQREPNHPARGA